MPEKTSHHLDTSAATTAETFLQPRGTGSMSAPASGAPASNGGSGGGIAAVDSGSGSGLRLSGSAAADSTTVPSDMPDIPVRIGRYEIKRLIGTGGIGAVYEAVQDQPRRTVALKVMRSAMASPMALRRFEYESQLLAKLRHPSIAQVYDAGTHQDGLTMQSVPYFAMEYIPEARSLTAYAEDANLSMRGRLELFLKVCDAVHHGHQRGVIHRDLKPANILVDQQGAAKIIDFGVARSADAERGAMMTQHTSVGQLVGTLQYMAPEQCGADTTDIDSRADVYALGVTLYELLAGKLPYQLSGRSLAEAVRMIREMPPTAPSTHRRELRGDLQTIILKALEKDPARRYDSVSALAADIQRYLGNEAILARRVGLPGRAVRWVKRNQAVATVGAIATMVLATTSVVLVAKIVRENTRANAELARANDNMSRIRDMFGAMSQNMERGLVAVGQVIDNAAERMDAAPPAHPATEADFREFLSEAYVGVSMFPKAVAQAERVLALREQIPSTPAVTLARSLHTLGVSLYWNGQINEAAEAYTRSLALREKAIGPKHVDLAMSMFHLAACRLRQGKLAEAEGLFQKSLEMRRELLPPGSKEMAQGFNALAKCLMVRGDGAGAERQFRQALEMIRAVKGDADLETSHATHNLATCLLENGNAEEARDLYARALAIRSAKQPATHSQVYASRLGLARASFTITPSEEMLDEAQNALMGLETQLKADHPDIAAACMMVGNMQAKAGHPDRAEASLRRAVSIYKDPARATAGELAEARLRLAQSLRAQSKLGEVEGLLKQVMETLATHEAPERLRADAKNELASFYETQGRTEDAKRVREGR